MTVTPQTNATLEEIAEAIIKNDGFCVCGHLNPDGDCLGSALGLLNALRAIGKSAYALFADDGDVDDKYSFMTGFDSMIYAGDFDGDCKCFIAVDASGRNRIGDAAFELQSASDLSITIDHHAVPERISDLNYVDPDSPSTTMIVWELVKHLGISRDDPELKDIAVCAYTGLLTDTGRFSFQNTTLGSFRSAYEMVDAGADPAFISRCLFQERSLASVKIDSMVVNDMKTLANGQVVIGSISESQRESVGATREDLENAINVLRSIKGTKIACILKERGEEVRGSLRSKDGTDISKIARELGGGGHAAAAGFTLKCSLDDAIVKMSGILEKVYD